MNEKFGWTRIKDFDNRTTYLDTNNFKAFKAKEQLQKIETAIDNSEFDAYDKIVNIISGQEQITKVLSEKITNSVFTKISTDDAQVMLNYLASLPQHERDSLLSSIRTSRSLDNKMEETREKVENVILRATIKSLEEDIKDKNIEELWNYYRQGSFEFWSWYENDKNRYIEEVEERKKDLCQTTYVQNMMLYSNNLILNLLGLLLYIFLKIEKEEILEEMKELIEKKKNLSRIAKEFSSEQYNERNRIEEIKETKQLISVLKKAEKTVNNELAVRDIAVIR